MWVTEYRRDSSSVGAMAIIDAHSVVIGSISFWTSIRRIQTAEIFGAVDSLWYSKINQEIFFLVKLTQFFVTYISS